MEIEWVPTSLCLRGAHQILLDFSNWMFLHVFMATTWNRICAVRSWNIFLCFFFLLPLVDPGQSSGEQCTPNSILRLPSAYSIRREKSERINWNQSIYSIWRIYSPVCCIFIGSRTSWVSPTGNLAPFLLRLHFSMEIIICVVCDPNNIKSHFKKEKKKPKKEEKNV